jgi:hypothetical protein
MKLRYIMPMLAAAGAAAAIMAAPNAMAAGSQSCSVTAAGSVCESPGNVQINDSAPVQPYPLYDYWGGDFFHGHYDRGHR